MKLGFVVWMVCLFIALFYVVGCFWLVFHVGAQDPVSDDCRVVDSFMQLIDVGFVFVAFYVVWGCVLGVAEM